MKNALLKTAFAITVILLMLLVLIPAQAVLEFVLPADGRRADGTYRAVDRLLPGIVVVFFCLWAADRITGLLFWKTHLCDERWSLLTSRRSRRLRRSLRSCRRHRDDAIARCAGDGPVRASGRLHHERQAREPGRPEARPGRPAVRQVLDRGIPSGSAIGVRPRS